MQGSRRQPNTGMHPAISTDCISTTAFHHGDTYELSDMVVRQKQPNAAYIFWSLLQPEVDPCHGCRITESKEVTSFTAK